MKYEMSEMQAKERINPIEKAATSNEKDATK
jgi:hypothetical protein